MTARASLTQRTLTVLEHIQAAGARGIDRKAVADLMDLPRVVVSSVFTRLENTKLIDRVTESDTSTSQKLTFKITPAGIDAIKRGPSKRVNKDITKSRNHNGVYAKAEKIDWRMSPRNVMTQPTYQPPTIKPARPDADQHLAFKSKGKPT